MSAVIDELDELTTKRLTYQGDRPGTYSVFNCIEQHANLLWPSILDAWLHSERPALGTQLVGMTHSDGLAVARLRGFWLTHDGWRDSSNRRMPSLVLPAAWALAVARSRSFSSELIVELYGEGYGDRRFRDLRALLTLLGVADPDDLPASVLIASGLASKEEADHAATLRRK